MQQLMHSFSGYMPPPEILDGVRSGQIASFCLFAYANVASPCQLYDLTEALYQAAREGNQPPPLIGIDQEGGQLMAIAEGVTELPGNMALGATQSPELAHQAGRILGRELLAMGINLNFAPSVDVNTNPQNPVVGIRSFGENPELVAELGAALIQAMQDEGVIATAKHFPGHGDTHVDSHHQTPVVAHSLQRTTTVELLPFRTAIEAGTGAILTSHVVFTALDSERPATLSFAILNDLLRRDMGFEGVTITDAMDMHAVAQYGAVESVRSALQAGADLVLLGHLPDQFALHDETVDLWDQNAVRRIQAMRQRIPDTRPPLRVIGCEEHQQIAQRIADQSITVVRGQRVPLSVTPDQMIAVVTPHPEDLTPADTSSQVRISLADAIRRRHPLVQSIEMPYQADEKAIDAVLQGTEQAHTVIVGTIRADMDSSQAKLVKALHQRDQNLIVVALRTPYDIQAFPMIQTYLCSYGIRSVSMEAVAKVLFGEITAQGILPCRIPGMDI